MNHCFHGKTVNLTEPFLGPEAFVVRFFSDDFRDDRLLVVNLGAQLYLESVSGASVGVPVKIRNGAFCGPRKIAKYGGNGTPLLDSELNWILPAHAAVVLKPAEKEGGPRTMTDTLVVLPIEKSSTESPETLLDKEWLVTNGLGGYASGSLAGVITRGFHGYLVAALPTPLGRIMMLNDLIERVDIPHWLSVQLSGEERVNAPLKDARRRIPRRISFRGWHSGMGLSIWRTAAGKARDHGAPSEYRACELSVEERSRHDPDSSSIDKFPAS